MSTPDLPTLQAAAATVTQTAAAFDAALKAAIAAGAKVAVTLTHQQVDLLDPVKGVMVCGLTAETSLVL